MRAKRLVPLVSLLATATVTVLVLGLAPSGAAGTPPRPQDSIAPAAPAVIGPNLLTSVPPCRLLDTRHTTPLVSGTARSFGVTGTDLSAQGGSSVGCKIPPTAKALTVNLTAVAPVTRGYLHAWAAGYSEPSATTLNYGTSDITVGTQIPLGSSGLTLKAFGGTTDIVVDVVGYATRPFFAYISDGVVQSGSRLSGLTKITTGEYRLTADANINGCAIFVTGQSGVFGDGYIDGATSLVVETWDSGVSPVARIDSPFTVSVSC